MVKAVRLDEARQLGVDRLPPGLESPAGPDLTPSRPAGELAAEIVRQLGGRVEWNGGALVMKTPVINILLASVLCFTLAACDNRDARRAADAAEKLVAMKEAEEAAERESNRREVEIQRAIERRQWQDREDNQNGQATFMLDVEIAARKRFPAGAGQEEEYKAAVTEGKDAIERRFGVRP